MTATLISAPQDRLGGHVTLYGVNWEAYESFIDSLGERPIRVN